MSLVIPPGYCSAAFIHTSASGTAPFVCTLGVDSSDWGGDYVDLANGLFDVWDATVLREIDTNVRLDRVALTIGADGPTGSVDSTRPSAGGARTGSEQAMAMACIVRKNTALFGRSGRGRMFVPGLLSTSDVSPDGSIVSSRVAEIQIELDAFGVGLVSNTNPLPIAAPPVLLHSAAGPSTPTPITSFGISPLVGWVRGRIR